MRIIISLLICLMIGQSCNYLRTIPNKLTLQELMEIYDIGLNDRREIMDYMISKGWVLKSDNKDTVDYVDTLSLVYGQYPEDKDSAILEYVIWWNAFEKLFGMTDPDGIPGLRYVRYATRDLNHYQSIMDELQELEWKLHSYEDESYEYVDPWTDWLLWVFVHNDEYEGEYGTWYLFYLYGEDFAKVSTGQHY